MGLTHQLLASFLLLFVIDRTFCAEVTYEQIGSSAWDKIATIRSQSQDPEFLEETESVISELSSDASILSPGRSLGRIPHLMPICFPRPEVGRKGGIGPSRSRLSPWVPVRPSDDGCMPYDQAEECLYDMYPELNNISHPCNASLQFFMKAVYRYICKNESQCEETAMTNRSTCRDIASENSWAMNVLDSLGRVPPGVLEGNTFWLGDWNECRSVKVRRELDEFNGQYCRASMSISKDKNGTSIPLLPKAVFLGLCVPDTCSSTDVDILLVILKNYTELSLRKVKRSLEANVDFSNVTCHPDTRHISEDGGAIAMITCLAVWGVVLLLATLYDLLQHQPILKIIRQTDTEYRLQKEAFLLTGGRGVVENLNDYESEADYCKNLPVGVRIILGLSVYSNALKILSLERKPGSFDCIHGMRFLSMAWVMLGHTYYYALTVTDNLGLIEQINKQPMFQTVGNATVSVDTFFVMSGILLAYLWLKETNKKKGANIKSPHHWFLYYFHRYVRLTSVYMIVLAIVYVLFKYMGRGPLWALDGVEEKCSKSWWTNLIYLNNFLDLDNLCMGHTWFLADDMQFHVFAPVLLILLYFFPWIAAIVAGILILGSDIYRGYYVATGNTMPNVVWSVNPSFNESAVAKVDYFRDVYIKPYMRWSPYIWGLLVGYVVFRTGGGKVKINKALNLLIWLTMVATCLAVVYGLYHWVATFDKMPVVLNGFYAALNRTAWGIAISWIVFACITGNGGFVNSILGWPGFFPVSRITYCAYLAHPYVLQIIYDGRDRAVHFDTHYTMVYFFIAHIVIGYTAAFVLSLAFESTVMNLEKILLDLFMQGGKSKSRSVLPSHTPRGSKAPIITPHESTNSTPNVERRVTINDTAESNGIQNDIHNEETKQHL